MKNNISISKFLELLPNEETCLTNLFYSKHQNRPCPKCGSENSYQIIKGRKGFQCRKCLNQIYPLKNTVLENSKTEVRKWLTAVFLITKSKNGMSAKQLALDVGVTYKCAWNMCRRIRLALSMDEVKNLQGTVEIDETYVGGKIKGFYSHKNKTLVLGICERGGRIKTFPIKDTSEKTIMPLILDTVKKGTTIYTDEHSSYRNLNANGYHHDFVTHKNKEWARGKVTTNTIESCWGRLKNTIRGTYIRLRMDENQKFETFKYYLAEFDFRHNYRNETNTVKFLKASELIGFNLIGYFPT